MLEIKHFQVLSPELQKVKLPNCNMRAKNKISIPPILNEA